MSKDKDDPVLRALQISKEVIAQSAHPSASYAFDCIDKAIAIQKQQAKVLELVKHWKEIYYIEDQLEVECVEMEIFEAIDALLSGKKP